MGMLLHLEVGAPTCLVRPCPPPLSEELLATAFHCLSAQSLPKCRAYATFDSITTGVTIFSHRVEILYEGHRQNPGDPYYYHGLAPAPLIATFDKYCRQIDPFSKIQKREPEVKSIILT